MNALKSKISIGVFLVALLTNVTSLTLFAQVSDEQKAIEEKA